MSAFLCKILLFFQRGAKFWTTKTRGAYHSVVCFNEYSFLEVVRMWNVLNSIISYIYWAYCTRNFNLSELVLICHLLCVTPLITGSRTMDSVQLKPTHFHGRFCVFLSKILNHILEVSIMYFKITQNSGWFLITIQSRRVGKTRYFNSAWVKSVRRKEKTCSGVVERGRIPAANVDVLLWSVQ